MGQTPDRFPGEREDEGILLEPSAVTPAVNGELRYVTSVGFRFFEEGVEVGLSGSGITEGQHEILDTLVHDISETSYLELTRNTQGRVTAVTYWDSPAKTLKVRESILTRNTQGRVTQDVTTQYDGVGAVKMVLTTVFTRNGAGRVVSAALTET